MKYKYFLFLLLLSCNIFAEDIFKISIISEKGKPIVRDVVLSQMELKEGGRFDPFVLSEDLKRLYKTGQFEFIKADINKLENGKVELVLRMTNNPRIVTISFEGNKSVKTKSLKSKTSHQTYSLVNNVLLAEDLKTLIKYYHSKGFYNVQIIQKRIKNKKKNSLGIVYQITENDRYKIKDIIFYGNDAFSEKQIKNAIESKPGFFSFIYNTSYLNERQLKKDLESIKKLYLDAGYFEFKILSTTKAIKKKKIILKITLVEGPAYKISKVFIQGNKNLKLEELQKVIKKFKAGKRYTKEKENLAAKKLNFRYQKLGYLDFYAARQIDVDKKNKTVSVTFSITEGHTSVIRDIIIFGNKTTRDHVIRRELAIQPGDKSNKNKIDASKSRLQNLGYFKTVEVVPVNTDVPGEKNLHIKLEEKATGKMSFGLGFSSVNSILGTFSVSENNFDLYNWPFLKGGGQRMRFRASLGSIRTDFSLSYIEPWLYNERLRLGVTLARRTRIYDEYEQQTTGINVSLTNGLKGFKRWTKKIGYRLQFISINSFDRGSSALLVSEKADDLVSAFNLTLTKDTRNRFNRPTKGGVISVFGEFQSSITGSDNDLYKLTYSASRYYGMFKKSVFKLSAKIGVVDNVTGSKPPIYERFFAGGLGTIRGYNFRDVGPLDGNNDPLGGQSILTASGELDFPLIDIVNGAVFMDVGNVWEDAYAWDPSDINVTLGIGLRIKFKQFGNIILDYGVPFINNQDNAGGGTFHFNIAGFSF